MLSLVKLIFIGVAVIYTTFLVQAMPLKVQNDLMPRDDASALEGQMDHLDQSGVGYDNGPENLLDSTVKQLNLQCNARPQGKYPDAHRGRVRWAATTFCNKHARTETSKLAPIGIKAVLRNPDDWYMAEDDNAKALISRVGLGDRWGDKDIFVLSIKGITKKEDPKCGEKGGMNGTASTNNLWEPHEDFLCEDFVYAGWRHCDNKGMGGSVDVSCLRYKIETVY